MSAAGCLPGTFQSTLPVWGGTHPHQPGAETRRDFNPPSPCGEGQGKAEAAKADAEFQSTLPVWGGTTFQALDDLEAVISIHPPRVGRDGGG